MLGDGGKHTARLPLAHCCWNVNCCFVAWRTSTTSQPTNLHSAQPRAAAGAIPCVNRKSLSRGTSKLSPQAQKALSIIVRLVVYTGVIDVCIIGLVYTEDFQISFVSLPLSLEALEPRRSSTEGKSPLPAPQLARLGLEGQSI